MATMWEAVADAVGDADALIGGATRRSWTEFDERSVASLCVPGRSRNRRGPKVAHYLYNGPEYLESTFASFKCRAVPVNVNYRYTSSELAYLFGNSDREAIIVDSGLVDHVVALLDGLDRLRTVIMVGPGECPDGVQRYEEASRHTDPAPRIDRSPDDLWFLYTGGTTGMPKGVMWPHRSLFGTSAPTYKGSAGICPHGPAEAAAVARQVRAAGEAIRLLPAAPLMHGTSAISSWGALDIGGAIVTLTSRSFDAAEMLEAVQAHRSHQSDDRRRRVRPPTPRRDRAAETAATPTTCRRSG